MSAAFAPTAPARALVIFNPIAGRRRHRRLAAVLERLSRLGWHPELARTTRRGDAEEAARRAAEENYDLIVVAGGDGTLNEAANGLAAAGRGPPLALVPLGTANVLAAELGLPRRPAAIARMLVRRRTQTIHLGRIGQRHFLLMASAGVDAAVVRGVDAALKHRAGRIAYAIEAVRQALRYGFPELAVTVDGLPYTARMVVASRARHYGGAFRVAPGADLRDDFLHAVLLRQGGPAALLRYAWALATGRLARLPDVEVVRGRVVTLDAPAGIPLQADGDAVGELPVRVTVSDRTINLVVP